MNHEPLKPQPEQLRGALIDYVESRTTLDSPPQVTGLLREAASRRRRRVAWVGTAAALAVAVPLTATALGGAPTSPDAGGSVPPDPTSTAGSPSRSGRVAMTEPGGCLGSYNPAAAMANAGFAFDGTVEAVEPIEERTGLPSGGLVAVRFEVATWYVGSGRADEVTVALGTPEQTNEGGGYGPGTRMLVSGEALPSGEPPYVAWGCGFTRYYDAETASQWNEKAD